MKKNKKTAQKRKKGVKRMLAAVMALALCIAAVPFTVAASVYTTVPVDSYLSTEDSDEILDYYNEALAPSVEAIQAEAAEAAEAVSELEQEINEAQASVEEAESAVNDAEAALEQAKTEAEVDSATESPYGFFLWLSEYEGLTEAQQYDAAVAASVLGGTYSGVRMNSAEALASYEEIMEMLEYGEGACSLESMETALDLIDEVNEARTTDDIFTGMSEYLVSSSLMAKAIIHTTYCAVMSVNYHVQLFDVSENLSHGTLSMNAWYTVEKSHFVECMEELGYASPLTSEQISEICALAEEKGYNVGHYMNIMSDNTLIGAGHSPSVNYDPILDEYDYSLTNIIVLDSYIFDEDGDIVTDDAYEGGFTSSDFRALLEEYEAYLESILASDAGVVQAQADLTQAEERLAAAEAELAALEDELESAQEHNGCTHDGVYSVVCTGNGTCTEGLEFKFMCYECGYTCTFTVVLEHFFMDVLDDDGTLVAISSELLEDEDFLAALIEIYGSSETYVACIMCGALPDEDADGEDDTDEPDNADDGSGDADSGSNTGTADDSDDADSSGDADDADSFDDADDSSGDTDNTEDTDGHEHVYELIDNDSDTWVYMCTICGKTLTTGEPLEDPNINSGSSDDSGDTDDASSGNGSDDADDSDDADGEDGTDEPDNADDGSGDAGGGSNTGTADDSDDADSSGDADDADSSDDADDSDDADSSDDAASVGDYSNLAFWFLLLLAAAVLLGTSGALKLAGNKRS